MLDYAGSGRPPSVCMSILRIGAHDPLQTIAFSQSGRSRSCSIPVSPSVR
jgi:hypothetical protein